MKTIVKDLLNARAALFAAVLAAIVGACAFSFSGVQQEAWAADTPFATWGAFTNDPAAGFTANDEKAMAEITVKDGKVTVANNSDAAFPACKAVINLKNAPEGASTYVEVEFKEGIASKKSVNGNYPADSGLEACEIANAQLMPITATVATKVTVTFETEHGVAPEAMEIEKGAAIGTLPVLTAEGFVFNGWENKADGTPVTAETVINENVTLKANWALEMITITFETEHGLSHPSYAEVIQVEKGRTAALPTLAEEGFVFNGWENKADGTPITADFIFNEDMVLRANWDVEMATITFETAYGKAPAAIEVDKGTSPESLPVMKDIKNYTFEGWLLNGKKFEPGTPVNENILLVADWQKKPAQQSEATPVEPTTFSIVVTKTDARTGAPLSGAEFTLKDKAGNQVAAWTTDGSGKMVELQRGTTYVLTETKAPAGYKREKAININYDAKGDKVMIDQGAKAVELKNMSSDGTPILNVKDLDGKGVGANTTAQTGDNKHLPLASFCFAAAALAAGAVATFAYRKRRA